MPYQEEPRDVPLRFVIDAPADFEQVDFPAMLRREGPTLLDVRIDRNEVPTMTLRLRTLGSLPT